VTRTAAYQRPLMCQDTIHYITRVHCISALLQKH